MKIDGMLGGSLRRDRATGRAALEADGYDGGATAETSHDPFLPLVARGASAPSGWSSAPASRSRSPARR